MIKSIIPIAGFTFFIGLISIIVYLLFPRSYDVLDHRVLEGTQYWHLSTGSRIAYVHLESKSSMNKTPIIYLHGGPGGVISERIVETLRNFTDLGHDVYAYDQIGSGSSHRLEDITEYTLKRHTDDLHAIIDKLGSSQVILLGQSWGSVLASFYVVKHPNRVEKIIMTSPGPIFPIDQNLVSTKAPDSLNFKHPKRSNRDINAEIYSLRDRWIRWYASALGKKWTTDQDVDRFYAHLNNVLNQTAIRDSSIAKQSTAGLGYYTHVMTVRSLRNIKDPRPDMAALDIPILILKGQYDHIPWGYTQEYVELFKNIRIKIIPNTGHFIDLEQPTAYTEEISSFLNAK